MDVKKRRYIPNFSFFPAPLSSILLYRFNKSRKIIYPQHPSLGIRMSLLIKKMCKLKKRMKNY